MIEMYKIVEELILLSKKHEYDIYPPVTFPEDLYSYNFGRSIGTAPRTFWLQYKAFVELADGFHMNGYYLYGIDNHDYYENDLFSYNTELRRISENASSLMSEDDNYLIQIGASSLDTFTYDVRNGKWQSRDRFQYDNLFISCDTLAEFLAAVLADIQATL
ncbi:hypothetical protein PMPD1_2719 [Paramixta manurensis]|uniref:SMI1/KNR4 family protein n=1 Tax=Paramixta manurensis TaxID=2740817 RepID=A0A6M8UAB6_9GAMM|nr:hypothetical protein PMPD1_2719 [Erwiniaceae bacterium PD-1]